MEEPAIDIGTVIALLRSLQRDAWDAQEFDRRIDSEVVRLEKLQEDYVQARSSDLSADLDGGSG